MAIWLKKTKKISFLLLAGLFLLWIFLPLKAALADSRGAYVTLKANTEADFYVDGTKQALTGQKEISICIQNSDKPAHTFKVVPTDMKNYQEQEKPYAISDWGDYSFADCVKNPHTTFSFTLAQKAPAAEESMGPPLPPGYTPPATKTNTSDDGLIKAGASTGGSGPEEFSSSSIRSALSPGGDAVWVINIWKVVLGLANMALVVVLAFLAAVNILHIQYDTYAIKKTLPILIIGVLLADFSLLIIRMLLDFSNILTMLFTMDQTPAAFAKSLISDAQIAMNTPPTGAGLGILFIWFLFSLLVMVAFFILGFLFYIRYVVIVACAIVAPLAFIAMAFPPTQSFFKQWWGWLTKFIFMKPIVFFMLWLAYQIRTQGGMTGITGWMIMAFLIIAAVIIPFKLGGSVMDMWGKAGKWLSGTKAGGYIRKPLDNFIQSKKDAWKERANLGAEKYLPLVASRRQKHALWMERMKAERQRVGDEAKEKIMGRYGKHLGEEKARQARSTQEIKNRDLLNDRLDRQNVERAKSRKQNEMRDRKIAAMQNIITKEQMRDEFENGKDNETGKNWALTLGELESKSAEEDFALDRAKEDAMEIVSDRKLEGYYNLNGDFKQWLKKIDEGKMQLQMIDQKTDPEGHAKVTALIEQYKANAHAVLDSFEGEETPEKIAEWRKEIDHFDKMISGSQRSYHKGLRRTQREQTIRAEVKDNTAGVKLNDIRTGNNQGRKAYRGSKDPAEDGGDVGRFLNGQAAQDDLQLSAFDALGEDIGSVGGYIASKDQVIRNDGIQKLFTAYTDEGVVKNTDGWALDKQGNPKRLPGAEARAEGIGPIAMLDRIATVAFNKVVPQRQQLILDKFKQKGHVPEQDATGNYIITAEMVRDTEIDRATENLTSFSENIQNEINNAESPGETCKEYQAILGVDENGDQKDIRLSMVGDKARWHSRFGKNGRHKFRSRRDPATGQIKSKAQIIKERLDRVQEIRQKRIVASATPPGAQTPAGGPAGTTGGPTPEQVAAFAAAMVAGPGGQAAAAESQIQQELAELAPEEEAEETEAEQEGGK